MQCPQPAAVVVGGASKSALAETVGGAIIQLGRAVSPDFSGVGGEPTGAHFLFYVQELTQDEKISF